MSRRRLRGAMIIGAVLVAVMTFTLSLLPYAVQQGSVTWLQQHGVKDAQIDNIDLNLFSGEVAIEGLKSGDGLNIHRLTLDFDWLPLWNHIVHVRALTLNKSNLNLLENKGLWQVAGIMPGVAGPDTDKRISEEHGNSWVFIVDDLVLDTVNVNVKSGLFELALPVKSLRFSLSGLQQQEQMIVNSFELGKTSFSGFGYSIHCIGAKVTGEFTFSMQAEDVVASIKSNNLMFDVQGLAVNGKQNKFFASAGAVMLDGIQIRGREHLDIQSINLDNIHMKHAFKGEGTLTLANLKFFGVSLETNPADKSASGQSGLKQHDLEQFNLEQFNLKLIDLKQLQASGFGGGNQSLSIAGAQLRAFAMSGEDRFQIQSMGMDSIHIKHVSNDQGTLQLKHLSISKINADLNESITIAKLGLKQFQGEHHQRMSLADAALSDIAISPGKSIRITDLSMHKADLSISDLTHSDSRQRMGAFENAQLKKIVMNASGTAAFDLLNFDGIQLPSHGKTSLGSIASVQASGAVLDKRGIYRLKQLKVDHMQVHLTKQKDGRLPLPWILNGGQHDKVFLLKAVKKTGKQGKNKTRKIVIIDDVVLGAGSRIEFNDKSVFPSFNTTIQVQQFHLAPLNNSGKRPGKLNMRAKIGKAGILIANGSINPVAGNRFSTDMHVVLKDGNLSRLSGYVEADFGRSIKTGQFNLDSDIRINNNKIDAKNKMLIRKLELGDSKQAGKIGKKISLAGGMSIDMALNMLRDNHDNIELDVPVSGSFDDPDINLGNIINKALLASLSTGAMTYAALILQPYGSIILAADLASGFIKDAVKPKVTPVKFQERGVSLSTQMNDYIAKIATLMGKTGLRLQVCGFATRIEGEAMMQPAPANATTQTEAVGWVAQPALEDAQLLDLAQKRSDVVMEALRALKIASNQLFNCRPQIDESKMKAQPRVELLLD